ncbi:AdoMet_MTases domain containing protein [Oxalobacteraceae bacterium]
MNSITSASNVHPEIQWTENDQALNADWRSESGISPPRRVVIADDTMTADTAYRLACEGTGLLWRGDFQNARQLLQALARRVDRPSRKSAKAAKATKAAAEAKLGLATESAMPDAFHRHRLSQSQRARALGMVLIPFDQGHSVPLRRAPDVKQACAEAYGDAERPYVTSLRELLGIVGAHEWRKKGVPIAVSEGLETFRIHPHYGVFAPVRTDYVPLLAQAPLPAALNAEPLAFDVGTGTGVLAVILAKRGIARVIATENNPRAVLCAKENLQTLGLQNQVEVVDTDLFPEGRAALVVCNPPWVPARPSSALEHAIFDPDSRMLRGFLEGLSSHLLPGGEGWLILSDFAEHLQLRSRQQLLDMIESAGLRVLGKIDAKPTHAKVADVSDALHSARAAEVVSLWRLAEAD